MKKILLTILSILALFCLLSTAAFAATVEFEDDYVKDGDAVFVGFNGTKPWFADEANVFPAEYAAFWLTDKTEEYNIRFAGFVGDMSSEPNFKTKYAQEHGKDLFYEATRGDTEWQRDFHALRNVGEILTDGGISYGVSLNKSGYCGDTMLFRLNAMEEVFSSEDFYDPATAEIIEYDINNFATIVNVNGTKYIVYTLELFPRQGVLDWFNATNALHQDKRAIVYTTSFATKDGEMYRMWDQDLYDINNVPEAAKKLSNSLNTTNALYDDSPRDGDQIWKYALKKADNLILIVSANDTPGKEIVTKTFTNDNGYEVVSVIANHIGGYASTGELYPLMMKISADNKTIDFRYAVPYYNNVGGYIEESRVVVNIDNIVTLDDPDPVSLLSKVKSQYNGSNTAYINGYAGNLFKPNDNMTKAEASTIFARLLVGSQTIPSGFETRFTDVKKGEWYYDAVAYLDANGFFYTTEGTTFNPNAKITRAEFVELAVFCSAKATINGESFKDVPAGSKYASVISTAVASGLVNGYGDGTFKPDATITRAEVVTVVNRALSLVANEVTVSPSGLETVFGDIKGHWAEYQILIASNNNVRSKAHSEVSPDTLVDKDETIDFSTKHIKITIKKSNAQIIEMINLYNGENIVNNTGTPWIAYLKNATGAPVTPTSAEVDNGRLKLTFKDKSVVCFVIETFDNYFTITLDSSLPVGYQGINFGCFGARYDWELDNPEKFGMSLIAMTTTAIPSCYPGGSTKTFFAEVRALTPLEVFGSKVGVTFSTMDVHREYLKEIVLAIDPKYGIKNLNGGPFTLDSENIFDDYIISGMPLTADNVDEVGRIANEYGFEQFSTHQGNPFIQADFNFVGTATEAEKLQGTFITAATFKERVTDKLAEYGVYLCLHTYSSLVPNTATKILTNPKWQRQICYDPVTYTCRGNVSRFRTNIKTNEDASGFVIDPNKTMPSTNIHSAYILIDEEIIWVGGGTSSGFINVKRGMCGTVATTHEDGAEIRQLLGWYNMFQSEPFSELFYNIAEETARAYNEGGFRAIYLDGLESFHRTGLSISRETSYIYAEFYREVLENCIVPPILESSSMGIQLWAGRGRGGAVDHAKTEYKLFKSNDARGKLNVGDYYYTATLGWFNPNPDYAEEYKNTFFKTMFRDDLDHMGSIGIAYNYGNCNQPFTIDLYNEQTRFRTNVKYYNAYSIMRKANYFSPEVREALKDNTYEYKMFRQDDGTWAFKQMRYFKNRVFDYTDNLFVTGTAENPFGSQTPYIRVEQRYSTLGENELVVLTLDETQSIKDIPKTHNLPNLNLSEHLAFKVRVLGNGSDGAFLISLYSPAHVSEGRIDYYIPTNFEGWREFILLDNDNANYGGFTFNDFPTTSVTYSTFRAGRPGFNNINKLTIATAGDVEGVMIDDIRAYKITDAPAKNITIKIGSSEITFDAEVHSGEYVEFYPETGKAYLNYYKYTRNEEGKYVDDTAHTKEISYTGSITVPKGKFNYTYSATPMTDAPLRANVVVGVSGKVIANPSDWVAPEVNLDGYYDIPLE